MFESDLASVAVAQFVDGTIDEVVGSSARRWVVLLVVALVGALGLLWVTRRSVADAPPLADGAQP